MTDEKSEESGSNEIVNFWLRELELGHSYVKPFEANAKRFLRRYRDERDGEMVRKRKFHVFWSNVETLKPAIYARPPRVQVERRFKDKDQLALNAGLIAERASQFFVDDGDFDGCAKEARDDYLIIGRGQLWVRYVPQLEQRQGPDGESYEALENEHIAYDYVHWDDFRHQRSRRWGDVKWVARRVYLSRKELVKKWEKVGEQVLLDYIPKDVADSKTIGKEEQQRFKRAVVWEIWDKASGNVYHIATGYKKAPLTAEPAPYNLKNFFPCPKPLYATMTTDSLNPLADFHFYEDQADQLDELQHRESILVKALRARGIYDASMPKLQGLLSDSPDGDMVAVPNFLALASQGGLKSVVEMLPTRDLAETLIRVYENQEKKKNEIYEITGIADIVRGVSAPSETAAAQQIKGQFATLRISDRQAAMQEFLVAAIRIGTEIICEKFSEQTLMAITGMEFVNGDQQAYMQALELLRNDALRSYRVTIETDSTIAIDEAADKAARSEFLNSAGMFMEKVIPLGQQLPHFMPVIGEMLMFGMRGYKVSRQLESAMQTAVDTMNEAMKQPQQPQPDPAMMELEQRMQLEQGKLQMEGQFKQAQFQQQAQMDGARLQLDAKKMEQEWAKEQQRAQLELQKTQATLALEAEKVRADLMLKAEGMRQKNTLDTARQTTAASAKGLKPDGKPHKPPVIRKVGKISRDTDGNKVVEMIEIPIEQEEEAAEGEGKAA